MPKPLMNLDDVVFDDVEENGRYTSSRGQISDHIEVEYYEREDTRELPR